MREKKGVKDYVVIYRSCEHYEVLGYIRARSLEEAKEKAKKTLIKEAKQYNVTNAMIFEIVKGSEVLFDL